MPIKLKSTGGGSVTLDVPSTGTDYTLTLPAQNGSVYTSGSNNISNGQTTLITTGYSVLTYNAGANLAAFGTWTPDPSNGNYQFANTNGALTIGVPTNNCAIDVLIWNGPTTGSITFSGYTAPSGGGGDTYATTAGNRYLLMIRKINSIATYAWKALQ